MLYLALKAGTALLAQKRTLDLSSAPCYAQRKGYWFLLFFSYKVGKLSQFACWLVHVTTSL
jgi:hypothetical protein